jgi:hypothetical protein
MGSCLGDSLGRGFSVTGTNRTGIEAKPTDQNRPTLCFERLTQAPAAPNAPPVGARPEQRPADPFGTFVRARVNLRLCARARVVVWCACVRLRVRARGRSGRHTLDKRTDHALMSEGLVPRLLT